MQRWLILGWCLCAGCAASQRAPNAAQRPRDAGALLGTPSALSNFDGRDAQPPALDASTGPG